MLVSPTTRSSCRRKSHWRCGTGQQGPRLAKCCHRCCAPAVLHRRHCCVRHPSLSLPPAAVCHRCRHRRCRHCTRSRPSLSSSSSSPSPLHSPSVIPVATALATVAIVAIATAFAVRRRRRRRHCIRSPSSSSPSPLHSQSVVVVAVATAFAVRRRRRRRHCIRSPSSPSPSLPPPLHSLQETSHSPFRFSSAVQSPAHTLIC
jgi:hypothetical protein